MSPLTFANARALFSLALASMIACGATTALEAQTAPETVRLVLREGSKLWIEGDSNLHAWKCDAKSFVPELRLVRAAPTEPPTRVQEARLQVSVADIECGNGKMNENLRKALKADTNANISFELTSAEFVDGVRGELDVLVKGQLSVAGASRDLQMQVSGTDTGNGALRLQGRVLILMTDYGVQPPTAMLGLLKTKNEVTILYDLVADYEKIEAALSRGPLSYGRMEGR